MSRPHAFPARFVVACERGHIDDFPWRSYTHAGQGNACDAALRLRDRGLTGSIGDVFVECDNKVHEGRSMGEAFSPDYYKNVQCRGSRPWLGARDTEGGQCPARPRTLLRGASNTYFAVTRSALSIPPWSDPKHELVAYYQKEFEKITSVEKMRSLLEIANYPELSNWSPEELFAALEAQRGQPQGSSVDLLWPEWNALIRPVPGGAAEFETEATTVPHDFATFISGVVLVRRLREVRALQGFTRIEEPDLASPSNPRIVPPSAAQLDWLPAVEVRGEGIFITLEEDAVRAWERRPETQVWTRETRRGWAVWRSRRGLSDDGFPGARFVLLHTLAHSLMRQASLDCGYSAGSIRERIYSSEDPNTGMSGLLLYTGTTDSDGSLGGLVELGHERHLGRLLRQALTEATYCASDPLCSDNRPGTNDSPNGAACHACLLASETSCENNNRILDRNAMIPTVADAGTAFFPGRLATA